jgi:hypothetical protein
VRQEKLEMLIFAAKGTKKGEIGALGLAFIASPA